MAVRQGAEPVGHTHPVALFAFKDLEGDAKERALEWLREGNTSDGALDGWRDSCAEDLKAMGCTLRMRSFRTVGGKTREEPRLYYNLDHTSSVGVAFDGTFILADLAKFDAKAHAPQSDLPALTEEKRIRLDHLLEMAPDATLTVEAVGQSSTDAKCTLDADLPEDGGSGEVDRLAHEVEADLSGYVKRLCQAFTKAGYEELEYLGSEEQCAESAEANGYTFTEDGRREG